MFLYKRCDYERNGAVAIRELILYDLKKELSVALAALQAILK